MTTFPSAKADNGSQVRIPPRWVFTDPWCFLGFGFGVGLVPKAPGTFGTLIAIPLYLLIAPLSLGIYLMVVFLLFMLGILICQRCEERIQLSDHSGIVWDEIVGYLITMIAIPLSWPAVIAGFVLFRVFDVLKPWPIRVLDRSIHGGLGIMLDDALAGLFAGLCLHLFLPLISP